MSVQEQAKTKELHRQHLEMGAIAALANYSANNHGQAESAGNAIREAIDALLREEAE